MVTAAVAVGYAASASAARDVGSGGCGASEVERTIGAYFRDLTRGHLGDALARVAPADRFNWYSVDTSPYAGRRAGVAAKRRTTLSRYLDARNAHGETWTLRTFTYHGGRQRVGDFGLSLVRAATDVEAGEQPMRGKGAVDCASGTITVLALDAPTPGRP